MTGATLTTVALGDDAAASLASVPAGPGVGQLLGPDERNLVIGRAANLRKWALGHLGQGPPPRKGARPRTDLRGVATALRFASTASEFGQRLRYERLLSRYVPIEKRRDLKPPAFLRLDAAERFPRVIVRDASGPRDALFGPFRGRDAAGRARDLLNKRFALRPCDYVFEPDPALPLGLGCVYAQVRTCAAPCLARVGEDAYRGLAGEAAAFLASPAVRGDALPVWVGRLGGSRALVVERTRAGWELFALREGSVVDERAASDADLAGALGALEWSAPAADDLPWVSAWLHAPRRKGRWLDATGEVPDAETVRAAFEQ